MDGRLRKILGPRVARLEYDDAVNQAIGGDDFAHD
jgi:hypothetical protein